MTGYAELQVTSNYSFLRGASHVEELLLQARHLGLPTLGITDRNSLAGIVRAHQRAEEVGVRLVVGCRLDLSDGTSVLAYPTDRGAYARLCRLLTLGKGRAGKGGCDLTWGDLAAGGDGLLLILLPDAADAELDMQLARLAADFPGRGYQALTRHFGPNDHVRVYRQAEMAARHGIPAVATGDVLYHVRERRILQDVLTCIREGCTIDDAGCLLERGGDRHLLTPREAGLLFPNHPEAVERTLEIVERCRFSVAELRYQYPSEVKDSAQTPQEALEALVWQHVPGRYPDGVPDDVLSQLRHELKLIAALEYAPYFLTVRSIVAFARSKEILCQGRGSAANSAICYVLGITSIDPVRSGLLFERFVSAERRAARYRRRL